jgi:hypothetical protein
MKSPASRSQLVEQRRRPVEGRALSAEHERDDKQHAAVEPGRPLRPTKPVDPVRRRCSTLRTPNTVVR